jgi:ABC-type antimicrobial peptide transport system permease subunit
MTVVVRSRGVEPAALTGTLRAAVRQLDPTIPLYDVSTMEERIRGSLAQGRFNTLLMLILGGAGLLLAAIGIYGVISYFVAQRQRELAIRLALGAPAGEVMRMVIAQGMRPVAAGIAIGLAAALVASRVLSAYVFGITTRDPLTMVVAIGVLLAAAFIATALPARRAIRVNPGETLWT